MSGPSTPSPVRVRGARRLPRAFYRRDATDLAPDLLNKVLLHGRRAVRVVEVEAYRFDDPASHSFRGPTARTASMFGPPGHLYVYLSYGMHWCANVVCGWGDGRAVLLRAGEPLREVEEMVAARPGARRAVDVANGPGKLAQALGLDRSHDGTDLVSASGGVTILDDGTPPPVVPGTGPRVGISVATDVPWRWWVPDDPHVSRAR